MTQITAGLDVETAGLPVPPIEKPSGVIPGIFIAIPAYGGLKPQTFQTCMALQHALFSRGHNCSFATYSFPDIAEIRNIFTTIWYDSVKMSHMLFIDSDMGFDPQLVLDMLNFDKPLVGALCPKRKLPIEFAGRAKPGQVGIVNGFMEVEGVGGAIMMVRRDCIDDMLTRYPGLSDPVSINGHAAKGMLENAKCYRIIRAFDHMVVNGERFSEDLSFCLRHKSTGGTVWANVMYPIVHVGDYEFIGTFFDTIKDSVSPMSDEDKAKFGVPKDAPASPDEAAVIPESRVALMKSAIAQVDGLAENITTAVIEGARKRGRPKGSKTRLETPTI